MNNFEIYKLKKSGLTNHNIINILDYQGDKKLSIRDMAVISQCRQPSDFIEKYRNLDIKKVKEDFNRFPSFSILDDCYPLALKEIYNPPVLLFYQGNIDLLNYPQIAIVGSRKASQKGMKSVQKIIQELQNYFVVVSGLAKGIDRSAHVYSIKNGGKTIAVIGTGLGVHYPKENKDLQDYMGEHHLVLSEYDYDEKPLKYHFPERNRIISGLSKGVIVAEAKIRSGSLITCERAMEEGRDVFAIPGSILDDKSAGCHHLIQEGAKCVTSGKDILEEYTFE